MIGKLDEVKKTIETWQKMYENTGIKMGNMEVEQFLTFLHHIAQSLQEKAKPDDKPPLYICTKHVQQDCPICFRNGKPAFVPASEDELAKSISMVFLSEPIDLVQTLSGRKLLGITWSIELAHALVGKVASSQAIHDIEALKESLEQAGEMLHIAERERDALREWKRKWVLGARNTNPYYPNPQEFVEKLAKEV